MDPGLLAMRISTLSGIEVVFHFEHFNRNIIISGDHKVMVLCHIVEELIITQDVFT